MCNFWFSIVQRKDMADEIVTVDKLVTDAAQKNAPPVVVPKKDELTPPAGEAPNGDETTLDPVKDLLKQLNFESLDALKERLKPKDAERVESPEEKERRENLYKVEMQKYAVENGLMKPDEFVKLEGLKAKDNQALVYENWLSGWKEENPDVDPSDVEARSKEDFNSEYHLDSDNEKKKSRGLAKIEREAKEIRNPLESSYTKVKTDFDEDREINRNLPDYNKKLAGFIQENIPEKVKVFEHKVGEETIPVEIELTAEERRAIYEKVDKKLRNSSTYQLYTKNDLTQLADIAKREAEAEIWAVNRERSMKEIAEKFLKKGDESGYKRGAIGAKNPFPLIKDGTKTDGIDHQSAQQQVLNSLQGKK